MRLRVRFVVAFLLLASTASAQLTTPQLQTLKTSIAAASDTTVAVPGNLCAGFVGTAINAIPNSSDGNVCVAAQYNLTASPTFTVWKTKVSVGAVGDNIVATELAGLTSVNVTRLQAIVDLSPEGINPSLTDRRAFFDDVFSGAGGTGTRAKLLILWKRLTKRGERLYATGTGSDAVPGLLVFEGSITESDVSSARNLP